MLYDLCREEGPAGQDKPEAAGLGTIPVPRAVPGWFTHCGLLSGSSTSRYAQIDITATETAHRVGVQHAQTREERLLELEQRKKGP